MQPPQCHCTRVSADCRRGGEWRLRQKGSGKTPGSKTPCLIIILWLGDKSGKEAGGTGTLTTTNDWEIRAAFPPGSGEELYQLFMQIQDTLNNYVKSLHPKYTNIKVPSVKKICLLHYFKNTCTCAYHEFKHHTENTFLITCKVMLSELKANCSATAGLYWLLFSSQPSAVEIQSIGEWISMKTILIQSLEITLRLLLLWVPFESN